MYVPLFLTFLRTRLNSLVPRYFTKDGLRGVCVYTRRETPEQGQRGFRLSSLGVLLARSIRPRPWLHVPALKALVRELQSNSDSGSSQEDIMAPARQFFELRKASLTDLGDTDTDAWHRWSEELDFDVGDDDGSDAFEVAFYILVVWNKFDSFFFANSTCHRRCTSPTSCAYLDPPRSRYTSTFSAADVYSYTLNRPSKQRASSAKPPPTCVSKTRRPQPQIPLRCRSF